MEQHPPIRRVGVLKSTGVADLVLLTGILRDLQNAYPEVILFCGKENRSLVPLLGIEGYTLTSAWRSIRIVHRAKLDVLLNFEEPSFLHLFFKARRVISLPYRGGHQLDHFRALALPLITSSSPPAIDVDAVEGAYVIFHASPLWPEEKWIRLSKFWKEQGYQVYYSGPFAIPGQLLPARVLSKLARWLKGAKCVVTTDVGIMHLAAALDTPLIGFLNTSERYRPLPTRSTILPFDAQVTDVIAASLQIFDARAI